MIFSCKNCGKHYRIDMAQYDGHAVRWACTKCGQEHRLRDSDNPDDAVVAIGAKGISVQSDTAEIFTITSRSTRRESDSQIKATVRTGGWYVTALGQRQGPVNDYGLMELLAAGKINPRTYVWRHPMPTWARMKDMKELEGLLAQAASGASGRADTDARQQRQPDPLPEADVEPPGEPSPWDSRISKISPSDELTGRHGIRGTPKKSEDGAGGRLADELFSGLDRPGIDIRDANTVPPTDDERPEDRWHSPAPRQEAGPIRENAPSWDETTQPGKKSAAPGRRDNTTTIVIAVSLAVVAVAAIVAVLVLLLNPREEDKARAGTIKPVAAAQAPRHQIAPEPVAVPAPVAVAVPAGTNVQTGSTTPVAAPNTVVAPTPTPPPAQATPPVQAVAPASPAPKPVTPPSIPRVVPVPDGIFDEADLTAFVREQVRKFSTCRTVMARKVENAISVNLMFNVAPGGAIETLVITPLNVEDPALNVCMQTIIRGWSFPAATRPVGFKGTIAIP